MPGFLQEIERNYFYKHFVDSNFVISKITHFFRLYTWCFYPISFPAEWKSDHCKKPFPQLTVLLVTVFEDHANLCGTIFKDETVQKHKFSTSNSEIISESRGLFFLGGKGSLTLLSLFRLLMGLQILQHLLTSALVLLLMTLIRAPSLPQNAFHTEFQGDLAQPRPGRTGHGRAGLALLLGPSWPWTRPGPAAGQGLMSARC